MFDETKDEKNEPVGAILVGNLENTDKPFVLYIGQMSVVNADSIASLVNEQFCKRFPAKSFKLFLTDGAPCCVKAGVKLRNLFDMIHVTCVVHATHLAFEEIRKQAPIANEAICTLKSLLAKSGSRRSMFPVAIPPWPVITRWGTWISCGLYLANNFSVIKSFVLNLEDEGLIVAAAKEAWGMVNLEAELAQLLPLGYAVEMQKKLEGRQLVNESLHFLNEFKEAVAGTPAELKLAVTLDKNSGFKLLREQPCTFRNAPIVTADVERLFSRMKATQTAKPNINIETMHKLLFMAL